MWHQSKSFLQLKSLWYQKLEDSGFKDIEDKSEKLKNPDTRTSAVLDREQILEFYLHVDELLNNTKSIPKLHKKVLSLYSEGVQIRSIAQHLKRHERHISRIIYPYKKMIIETYFPLR